MVQVENHDWKIDGILPAKYVWAKMDVVSQACAQFEPSVSTPLAQFRPGHGSGGARIEPHSGSLS